MEKLLEIIRGNWYRLTGKKELLFWKRYAVCRTCPLNSKNKKNLSLLGKIYNFFSEHCTDCKCPLQSKLREPLSECPELYWKQELK